VSTIIVLKPAFAKLAAIFAEIVVLPSPSPGLVTRIDFGSLILRANWTFVLKILNDSAIEDFGLSTTKIDLLLKSFSTLFS